jgi:hypothetical protein
VFSSKQYLYETMAQTPEVQGLLEAVILWNREQWGRDKRIVASSDSCIGSFLGLLGLEK